MIEKIAKKIENFFYLHTKNDKHFKQLVLKYMQIKKVGVVKSV